MDYFVSLLYTPGDPVLTIVKLVFVIMCLELLAVMCSFLGRIGR